MTRFNTNYNSTSTTFWNTAPSNPTSVTMNGNSNAYTRPGTSYLALRAILGKDNYNAALHHIQRGLPRRLDDRGEPQDRVPQVHAEPVDRLLEQARRVLQAVVGHAVHGLARRPATSRRSPGPGLAGGGFYDANGGCADYGVDVPGTAGGTVPATLSLTLGTPAAFGAVHAGRGEGLHGLDDRQRHLHGGRRGAVDRRPERDRSGPPGQRRVLAAGGAEGHGHQPGRHRAPAGGDGQRLAADAADLRRRRSPTTR